VKEVVKAIRKGDQGLLLLASNITPVDVISHMPLLAEEAKGVEYCWVLSK
jgi:H/ACA ribonucleoprotein complex subunit 2